MFSELKYCFRESQKPNEITDNITFDARDLD